MRQEVLVLGANGLRVGIIDAKADQILRCYYNQYSVGYGVTQAVPANTVIAGAGTTSLLDGYFKGLVTEVDELVKLESKYFNMFLVEEQ